MKRLIGLLIVFLFPVAVYAQSGRFIVRLSGDQQSQVAADHGLSDVDAVPAQNVFLFASSDGTSQQQILNDLRADSRVQKVEPDVSTTIPELDGPAQLNRSTAAILGGVFNSTPVSYFGTQAPGGYVNQPATALIRLAEVQRIFQATGRGVVAIIDTGVDPNHPVLQPVLVPGYDFTRNTPGIPSELADLPPATAAILTQSTAVILDKKAVVVLNQSTAAILDQSTAAILDTSKLPLEFGHGTMVAGIVHLAAPTASIMPLKAFKADGTASLFDIIRAIYYAVDNGARVINLSFNLVSDSPGFTEAINYAHAHRVIVVASVGNSATSDPVKPAAMKNVFGVASTNNHDKLSSFSNYGSSIVDLAAPGEGIITTYPGKNYAAAWGTSFSAPFVTGGVALLKQFSPYLRQPEALQAFSSGKRLTMNVGYGRIDLSKALRWLTTESTDGRPRNGRGDPSQSE